MATENQQNNNPSHDEVDFIHMNSNHYNNNDHYSETCFENDNKEQNYVTNDATVPKMIITKQVPNKTAVNSINSPNTQSEKSEKTPSVGNIINSSTKEKLNKMPLKEEKYGSKFKHSLFNFNRKSQKLNKEFIKQDNKEKNGDRDMKEGSTENDKTLETSSINGSKSDLLKTMSIESPLKHHKFVKSSSIARLLGNTYNAKKFEKQEQKRKANEIKFHTYSGRRRDSGPYFERFKNTKEELDVGSNGIITLTTDNREFDTNGFKNEMVSVDKSTPIETSELGTKALRTLTKGLGKLWFKRTHSVDISAPDPEYKVSYLGNVLTGWAKGEGCVEKQLQTLWRNYTQNNKPDVIMRIKVSASGLKATTRQHGLTEYWANRITHCCAPKNFPRVFCWIYRHEGRKLKHELRCHAVLCSKEKIVQEICDTLKENLETALKEFKREKILKQNARLSLANAIYDNPSLPRRKILLSVGGNNYRPPMERSKSAPKLTAIEEAIGEDGEEAEDTNEPEMKSCCQKDSLYPAMTLGRRHCRRGHSIRRTGKVKISFESNTLPKASLIGEKCCGPKETKEAPACISVQRTRSSKDFNNSKSFTTEIQKIKEVEEEHRTSYGSDESDEFEKLLRHNDYDSKASLTNELLPFFDLKLCKNTSCSLGSLSELKNHEEPLSMLQTINSDPNAHPDADYDPNHPEHIEEEAEANVGLRRNGVCSDGEEDYLDGDDLYFRQASILNMLHRHSMRKMATLNLSSDESSLDTHSTTAQLQHNHQTQTSISSNASSTNTDLSSTSSAIRQTLNPDSDEGSISSGCETASTATANQDDLSLKYRQSKSINIDQHLNEYAVLDEEPITVEDIYQRLESRLDTRNNSDATTFSSSSSITLKMGSSPNTSSQNLDTISNNVTQQRVKKVRKHSQPRDRDHKVHNDSDSECSDESGYVEYQNERASSKNNVLSSSNLNKPQIPPKPAPRRSISQNSTDNIANLSSTPSTTTAV